MPVSALQAIADLPGRRARTVRPAPAAAAPRRSATPWTDSPARQWPTLKQRLRAGCTRCSSRSRPSSPRSWARPGSAPARPTCSGSAWPRSRPSQPVERRGSRPGARGGSARLRRHAPCGRRGRPRGALVGRRRARRPRHRGGSAAGARLRPRPRRGGRSSLRPDRRDQLPALRRGRRRRVVRHRARDRPCPARCGVRAARCSDRPDPQVRRDRRRGPGLGRGPPRSGCSTSTTPRSVRPICASTAPGCVPTSRSWPRGCRRLDSRQRRSSRRPSPPSSPPSRCRTRASRSGSVAPRTPTASSSTGRPGGSPRSGIDQVEILLAANTGSEPRPLHKGASGGELSRVMLAIEVVLAGTSPVPTFVFDEVDAGVGGKAAVEIGRRLAALARIGPGARGHPPAPGGGLRRPPRRGRASPVTAP